MGNIRYPRRVLAATAVVAGVVLLAVVGTGSIAQEQAILAQALSYRGQTASSDVAVNSIAARSSIYVTGFRVWKAYPLLGVGFRLPTRRYDASVFQRAGQVYAFESVLLWWC